MKTWTEMKQRIWKQTKTLSEISVASIEDNWEKHEIQSNLIFKAKVNGDGFFFYIYIKIKNEQTRAHNGPPLPPNNRISRVSQQLLLSKTLHYDPLCLQKEKRDRCSKSDVDKGFVPCHAHLWAWWRHHDNLISFPCR